jgi:quinol---cytochrome-c reductase cytochrome c subunit
VNDDIDDETELGFEPAVSATGAAARDGASDAGASKKGRRRGGLRRRVGATVLMLVALGSMGGAYAAFAADSGAAGTGMSNADIQAGRQLFQVSCITCHGANLEGVKGNGPSIIGAGAAAVYFQVSTGRMPAVGQGPDEPRKTAKYDDAETRALAAYVQSLGGGQDIPSGELRSGDATISEGGELFRVNCASCHGVTFKGAPLSGGKEAPALNESTDLQMWTAMLSGPESMPVFSNNQLTVDEKRAIVAYVQALKASADPGGSGIDRIGPVSEAIVIWVAGVGALMVAILWIGAKTE